MLKKHTQHNIIIKVGAKQSSSKKRTQKANKNELLNEKAYKFKPTTLELKPKSLPTSKEAFNLISKREDKLKSQKLNSHKFRSQQKDLRLSKEIKKAQHLVLSSAALGPVRHTTSVKNLFLPEQTRRSKLLKSTKQSDLLVGLSISNCGNEAQLKSQGLHQKITQLNEAKAIVPQISLNMMYFFKVVSQSTVIELFNPKILQQNSLEIFKKAKTFYQSNTYPRHKQRLGMTITLTGLVDKDINESLRLLDLFNDHVSRFANKDPHLTISSTSAFARAKEHFEEAVNKDTQNTLDFEKRFFYDYGDFKNRHSQQLSNNLTKRNVLKLNQRAVKARRLFTVIRSPFIFKKTREQFSLNKKTCIVKLDLARSQQELIMQLLCSTKLPAELKIVTHH